MYIVFYSIVIFLKLQKYYLFWKNIFSTISVQYDVDTQVEHLHEVQD